MCDCPCIVCIQTGEVRDSPTIFPHLWKHPSRNVLLQNPFPRHTPYSVSTDTFTNATTRLSQVGIIERLGKFSRISGPGVNYLCCPVEYVADKVSMRVQQLNVTCETKTLDNVFVVVQVIEEGLTGG